MLQGSGSRRGLRYTHPVPTPEREGGGRGRRGGRGEGGVRGVGGVGGGRGVGRGGGVTNEVQAQFQKLLQNYTNINVPLPKAYFSIILLVEDNLLHGEVWLESLDQRKGPVPDCLLTRSNTQDG